MENPDAQNVAATTADKVFAEKGEVAAETAPTSSTTVQPEVTPTELSEMKAPEATPAPVENSPAPAEAAASTQADRYYTQTQEYQNQQTQQEQQAPAPAPTRSKPLGRFAMAGAAIGAILGAIVLVSTFRNRSKKSLISAAKETSLFTPNADDSAVGRMNKLNTEAIGRIDDKTREGFLSEAKESGRKVLNSLKRGSNHKDELSKFVNDGDKKDRLSEFMDIGGERKNNGLFPLVGRGVAALLGIGASGGKGLADIAYAAAIEGNSHKRARKHDPRAAKKLEKIHDKFSDQVYHAIGKEDKKVKVGAGSHVKNGIVAGGMGLVTMGATMAVSHFMEKWNERRQAAKYAEQVEMDRQIAMIQPQTQVGLQ